TAARTHQVSAVKTAFADSSTVTAQMLRRIKVNFTTDQQELWRDSFGPYLQQESM
ncbi:hypothetical protein M9458_025803, partial [Cirrhinus mrigala]